MLWRRRTAGEEALAPSPITWRRPGRGVGWAEGARRGNGLLDQDPSHLQRVGIENGGPDEAADMCLQADRVLPREARRLRVRAEVHIANAEEEEVPRCARIGKQRAVEDGEIGKRVGHHARRGGERGGGEGKAHVRVRQSAALWTK